MHCGRVGDGRDGGKRLVSLKHFGNGPSGLPYRQSRERDRERETYRRVIARSWEQLPEASSRWKVKMYIAECA